MAQGISYGPTTDVSITLDLIKKELGEGIKSISDIQEKMDEVIRDNSKHLEAYNKGNRFVRAWKVLIGKL